MISNKLSTLHSTLQNIYEIRHFPSKENSQKVSGFAKTCFDDIKEASLTLKTKIEILEMLKGHIQDYTKTLRKTKSWVDLILSFFGFREKNEKEIDKISSQTTKEITRLNKKKKTLETIVKTVNHLIDLSNKALFLYLQVIDAKILDSKPIFLPSDYLYSPCSISCFRKDLKDFQAFLGKDFQDFEKKLAFLEYVSFCSARRELEKGHLSKLLFSFFPLWLEKGIRHFFEPIQKLPLIQDFPLFAYILDEIMEKIEKGENFLLPGGIKGHSEGEEFGHFILYSIEKEEGETFSFSIIDTNGDINKEKDFKEDFKNAFLKIADRIEQVDCNMTTTLMTLYTMNQKKKDHVLIFKNLAKKELSKEFFKKVLDPFFYARKEANFDELYAFFSSSLGQPVKGKTFSVQKKNSCQTKPLYKWLKSQTDLFSYRQFQEFVRKKEYEQLEKIKNHPKISQIPYKVYELISSGSRVLKNVKEVVSRMQELIQEINKKKITADFH